jgi:anti-sigma B factor antagonist
LASRFLEEVSVHGLTISAATQNSFPAEAAALFRVATTAGVCVVAASGELDLVTCRRLAAVLERELGSRPSGLIVDASAVTFCGARGMRVLLEVSTASCAAEVSFAIVGRCRAVLHPITALELEQLLPVYRRTAEVRRRSSWG